MNRGFFMLIAVVIICSCGKEKTTMREKDPTRVKTERVATVAQTDGPTYVGVVEENQSTAVSFTGMGVVKHVYVAEGQAVSRGQLIAEMDDTQARNLLSGAEAAMAQANDAMARYKQLHDNGSLPEIQWVEIQSKVAQAKSQLDVARKNLSDCRLTAPVGGIIGRKQVTAGETALPSQAVVSILDISSVKVKVSVPETEISAITPRTFSLIQVDALGRSFQGGRIEKGVAADAMTHTYDVRIHVPNADRKLLPGMVADVRFSVGQSLSPAEFDVPVTAVQKRADGSLFVWTVADDSTVHRTAVTIGRTVGNRVGVTSGVSAGQVIVTEGYQKLSEGTRVTY